MRSLSHINGWASFPLNKVFFNKINKVYIKKTKRMISLNDYIKLFLEISSKTWTPFFLSKVIFAKKSVILFFSLTTYFNHQCPICSKTWKIFLQGRIQSWQLPILSNGGGHDISFLFCFFTFSAHIETYKDLFCSFIHLGIH